MRQPVAPTRKRQRFKKNNARIRAVWPRWASSRASAPIPTRAAGPLYDVDPALHRHRRRHTLLSGLGCSWRESSNGAPAHGRRSRAPVPARKSTAPGCVTSLRQLEDHPKSRLPAGVPDARWLYIGIADGQCLLRGAWAWPPTRDGRPRPRAFQKVHLCLHARLHTPPPRPNIVMA